jgi:uncharacterized protein (DUF952 family)
MGVETVYRVLSAAEWARAVTGGQFDGSALDQRDGFIHLSLRGQVAETLATHFAGSPDLLLLEIDAAALGAALRLEPSRSGALFPHLYRPLRPSDVRRAFPLPLAPDGRHELPRVLDSAAS